MFAECRSAKLFSSVSEKEKQIINKGVLKKNWFVRWLKKDQMFSFSHSEVLPGKSLDEKIIFVIYFNAVWN